MAQAKGLKNIDLLLHTVIYTPGVLPTLLSIGFGFAIVFLLFVLGFPLFEVVIVGLGLPFACLFLLLPLEYSATLFFIFMMLNHYYLSPVIFPVAGLELHPRELMNFLFLANFAVNIVFRRVYWRKSVFLVFNLLYILFFVYIAVVGFLSGYDWHRVVAETRFPAFFISSFIFPFAWKSIGSLKRSLYVILSVAVVIALATYALFFYTLVTGNLIRTQNFLGEFLPAKFGPLRLQEVRFNGHLFFEVCFGIALAQFLNTFKRDNPDKRYRWAYYAGMLFFIPPILILMMNTALVSVAFASALIVVMSLPRRLRPLAVLLFTLCVVIGLFTLALLFYLDVLSWTNSKLGISLQARLVEITGALENFYRKPIQGAGMGSQFEGLGLGSNFWKDLYALTTYQTLHNLWVYWLFKGGIIGFAIISIALAGILLRSGYIVNVLIPLEHMGFWLGYWGVLVAQVMVMSLAFPRLSYPIGQVYLAFSIGIFVILEEAFSQGGLMQKNE